MTPGMGGKLCSSAWHKKMVPSRLLQQGSSKGKSRAGKGRCCQLGWGCDRKDLPAVKVTGWCGSHLCTRVTDQGGGMSMRMVLGCAGQDTGHPQGLFFRGCLGLDTGLTHGGRDSSVWAGPVHTWVGICFSLPAWSPGEGQGGKHQTWDLQPCCGISLVKQNSLG